MDTNEQEQTLQAIYYRVGDIVRDIEHLSRDVRTITEQYTDIELKLHQLGEQSGANASGIMIAIVLGLIQAVVIACMVVAYA